MKRLVFAPAALDYLRDIAGYIADDNQHRALSFLEELELKARHVAEWPTAYPERNDISEGLRVAVHGRYLILFRDLRDEVRVVRVVHGARDLHRLAGV